jgi:hypothetical protein
MILSDVNLVKNLASSLQDYDALVLVATQLDDVTGFVDASVTKDLQSFVQVKIKKKTKNFFRKLYFNFS